mgnify:CR=1 FL=1
MSDYWQIQNSGARITNSFFELFACVAGESGACCATEGEVRANSDEFRTTPTESLIVRGASVCMVVYDTDNDVFLLAVSNVAVADNSQWESIKRPIKNLNAAGTLRIGYSFCGIGGCFCSVSSGLGGVGRVLSGNSIAYCKRNGLMSGNPGAQKASGAVKIRKIGKL